MAGLVRPKMFPIREVTSDKQDAGMIYNPKRMAHHGGLDSSSKWPKGDAPAGLMGIDTPSRIKTADESRHSSDD